MAINSQEVCLKSLIRGDKNPTIILLLHIPINTGPYNRLVEALVGCSLLEPVPDAESPPPSLRHLSCLWRDSIQALPKPEPV